MMEDVIKMQDENNERLDKKQIALAIRNSVIGDELSCSLLSEEILKSCDDCGLKYVCSGIDNTAAEYEKSISKVVKKFSFEE